MQHGTPPGPAGGYGPPAGYGSYGLDRGSLPTMAARQTSIPPKKGGSSVGVILGAGCALVLVLVAVAAVGLYVVLRARGGSTATPSEAPPTAPVAASSVSARDLRDFTGSRGQVMFVTELVNAGNAAVTPSARLRLLDGRRNEVASVPCAVVVRQLGPGEKLPCTFSYSGAKSSFTSSEVLVDARPASGREARLVVQGGTLARAAGGQQVTGTIVNTTTLAVRSVAVVVTLYGNDGRIVGAGNLELRRDLAAGGKAPFSVTVADVASPAKTFAARAVGSPD